MADLLISRSAPGVALVRSVDPFDTLEIHRIERPSWQATPETAGVYLLHGVTHEGKVTVYIGMSTKNMRSRIRSHHVSPNKNWFGVLFAVPVANALLCPAIEAVLIGQVSEAGVVDVIANVADEHRLRDIDDVHVEPAVEKISDALQLILGSDIFSAQDAEDGAIDPPVERLRPLARENRGRASDPRKRTTDDPDTATHTWVGGDIAAWGHFEADPPDTRFRVLAGSNWRRASVNPDAVTSSGQRRVAQEQDQLRKAGILDDSAMTFKRDNIFDNWTRASRVVGGKRNLSGAYRWQRLI